MIAVPGRVMLPHQYLKKLLVTWNWVLTRHDNESYNLRIGKFSIKITPYFFNVIYGEWLDWKRYYLPFSLKGKTILDVGAGCGETALFYFLRGAKRVVCVEPDRHLSEIIKENIHTNAWNAEVLNRQFDLDLFDIQFDFMKMDCEGCETKLFNATLLPPCVIEVHDEQVLAALKAVFNLSLGAGSLQYLIGVSQRRKRQVNDESAM
ncbi:MAG TPA: RsmD family RNA methyltransferase [Candidatus Bathyarchaeia archaeon]|nr:RsmD family RNA methyltransferase [Candidatus Bathyarchaeia archaeon]